MLKLENKILCCHFKIVKYYFAHNCDHGVVYLIVLQID